LAVNVGAVAIPLASVITEAVAAPAAKVPLAPLAGAVNVTLAPDTALPPLSVTAAFKAANAVLMTTLCGVPELAVMLAGALPRLVRENVAGEAKPTTVALTE